MKANPKENPSKWATVVSEHGDWRSTAMVWWYGAATMVDSLSFSHFDPLFHSLRFSSQIICGFWFVLNFCCGSLRSAWIGYQNRQQRLKIGGNSVVVWRSATMVDSLSFSHSDPLFLSLRFSLSDWMWVLVLLWIFCRFNPNRFASFFFFFCFVSLILILLLGFQFLMEFVFHGELEFYLLGCLICKVSNKGK